MNKYSGTIERDSVPNECGENVKNIKERMKRAKDNLDFAVSLVDRDLVGYDEANAAVGRAYMNVVRCENDMKRHKARKKAK